MTTLPGISSLVAAAGMSAGASVDGLVARAHALHAEFGCLQSAIDLFDEAIGVRPDRADLYAGRAYIHMYARKDAQALQDANHALLLDPSLALALYIRATVLFDTTRRTQTASGRSYRNAHDAEVRQRARAAFARAEHLFRTATAVAPIDRADARLLLARLYALRRLGGSGNALAFLEDLLRHWPSPAMRVWIDVAAVNTLLELGRADDAARVMRDGQARIGRLPLARSWLMYNQALRLDAKRALPLFVESLALFERVDHSARCRHAVDYVNRVAACYEKVGAVDSAVAVLSQGLERYPGTAPLLHARGLLLSDRGRTDDALRDMYRARDVDPGSITRYNAIMAVLGDARRFPEMWAVAQECMGVHGGIGACTDVCFLSMVVIAATSEGQYDTALAASDRMLTMQAFLAPGDIEYVGAHRARLFDARWKAMQGGGDARRWLLTTGALMHQKRIVDLHAHLCADRAAIDLPVAPDGCTALFWAAAECTDRPELAERLVLHGYAQVDRRNCTGRTALAYAVQNNHPRIARVLIGLGADADLRDCHGRTALSYFPAGTDGAAMARAFADGHRVYRARRRALLRHAAGALDRAGLFIDRHSFALVVRYWAPAPSDVVEFVRQSLAG